MSAKLKNFLQLLNQHTKSNSDCYMVLEECTSFEAVIISESGYYFVHAPSLHAVFRIKLRCAERDNPCVSCKKECHKPLVPCKDQLISSTWLLLPVQDLSHDFWSYLVIKIHQLHFLTNLGSSPGATQPKIASLKYARAKDEHPWSRQRRCKINLDKLYL